MKTIIRLVFLPAIVTFFGFSTIYAQTLNETSGTGSGVSITTGDFNTFYGDSTGSFVSAISRLTLIGYGAGRNMTNSTASGGSVMIGYLAGFNNTTGQDNTFIGEEAGLMNTTATDNTFIGTNAGRLNTSGEDNTFVGEEAGINNTIGRRNTFIGEDAGFDNTSGERNTFVGKSAGRESETGYRNTGIGHESLYDVKIGHHNTAIGDSSGIDVNAGVYNTFIGAASGVATEFADYNTFVGAEAGWDNNRTNSTTNANRNTYLGFRTGFTNREGQDNVGIGAFADYDFNIRQRTVFIGAASTPSNNDVIMIGYSGFNDGQYSISMGFNHDIRGTGAIGIGSSANLNAAAAHSVGIGFETNISENQSVGIGYRTDIDNTEAIGIGASSVVQADRGIALGASTSVTGINSIAIGFGTNITAANQVFIGNAAHTSIGGTVNWTATSDERVKANVQENIPGLSFVNSLRPVSYNYNTAKINELLGFKGVSKISGEEKENQIYSGFLAQEVEKAAEIIGYDFSGIDKPKDKDGMYGIRYAEFVVPLVKAVQELDQKVKTQEEMLLAQSNLLAKYEATLKTVMAKLDAQSMEKDQVIDSETILASKEEE